MKTEHKVIALSLLLGLSVWVIDALIDHLFFYKEPFLRLLITDIPRHGLYTRSIVIIYLFAIGLVTSRVFARHGRIEQALRDGEEKFRTLSEQSLLGIYIIKDDRVVYANDKVAEILGCSIDDILKWDEAKLVEAVHPEDREFVREQMTRTRTDEEHGVHQFDCRIIDSRGEVRWLSHYSKCIGFEGRTAVETVVMDITGQRLIQEAIARGKKEWERTFDSVSDPIALMDTNSNITRLNMAMADKLGLRPQEAIGLTYFKAIHSMEEPPAYCPHARLLTDGQEHRQEMHIERLDGDFIVTASPLHSAEGQLLGSVYIAHDITERKRVEEALRNSEEFNRDLVTLAPVGIAYLDAEGRVAFINPALSKMMEVPEDEIASIIGSQPDEISHLKAAGLGEYLGNLLHGEPIHFEEVEFISSSGAGKVWNIYAEPRLDPGGGVTGAVVMCVDTTDYKELQAHLRQVQKLEAMGTLAEGIAHDFNNLLLAILGNVELALRSLEPDSRAVDNLDAIQRSADRAAQLTSQLLTFGHSRMDKPRPVILDSSIDEVLTILRRTIDPRIELTVEKEPDLWVVMTDTGQMQQVLINLLVNARDALKDAGCITLRTENITVDKEHCLIQKEAQPGDYVRLTVADTGEGIPVDIMPRIFEPFFTTKEPGKGTGLGLATVYGIVKAHNGWIEVKSAPNQETTFQLYLPRVDVEAVPEVQPVEEEELPGGSETILMVDDETEVLNIGSSILKEFGYKVVTAKDGLQALDVYKDRKEAVDLVILDLSMPRMSGRETLQGLLEMNPDLKVIISSGFARSAPVNDLLQIGASGFIQKPYRIRKLLQTVRGVLDGKEV